MSKDKNDQSAKADAGKLRLTMAPRKILWDVAATMEYGRLKYPAGGRDNWKNVDVQRYRDAAARHFVRYLDNPDGLDDESGLYHLQHLAFNICVLCALEDLPLPTPELMEKWIRQFSSEEQH